MKKALHKISSPGESIISTLFKFTLFAFTKPGIGLWQRKFKKLLLKHGLVGAHQLPYHDWVVARTESKEVRAETTGAINAIAKKTKFSIIVLLDEYSIHHQHLWLKSVNDQLWGDWELFILCPATYRLEIDIKVRECFANPEKVSVKVISDPTIFSSSLHDIITRASGECILLLDSNDALTPVSLFEIARHLNQNPHHQIVYTDSDTMSLNPGNEHNRIQINYSNPYFKPDWSPDKLLSGNYIGDTFAVQKPFFEQQAMQNSELENYAFDLLLRAGESTNNIGHISSILYHSFNPNPICCSNDVLLLERALKRRAHNGTVAGSDGLYSVKYNIDKPCKVSIIIPSKDNVPLLRTTLDSIIRLTDYRNYEIILLNNNSTSDAFFELVIEFETNYPLIFKCVEAGFPFNFSKLINLGVKESSGDYILMLNNDVKVLQNDWIERMIGYAQLPHIGAVGVKLVFPDDTIQHTGIIMGVAEATAHAFIGLPKKSGIHFNYIQSVNNYSAVTAACLMVRKNVFIEVRGMDEELPVEFNDIDFCLKLGAKGYYNVYLPFVELYHYESATRGHPFKSIASWKQHQKDLNRFRQKWGTLVDNDPFYNRNLSKEETDFRQERRTKT